ncbi:MAG: hypothetical protein BME94_08525, partial [Methanobacteriales archaeon Met13]
AKTRRNKDGNWVKKGGKSHFGYKLHVKTDIDYGLIRAVETTPANVHDSQIDLSKPDEVVYRDRGYFGAPCKGYNATMDRNVRGHKITIRQKNAQQKNHPQKSALGTPIRSNQKYFQLRPPTSNHKPPNPHKKTYSAASATTCNNSSLSKKKTTT